VFLKRPKVGLTVCEKEKKHSVITCQLQNAYYSYFFLCGKDIPKAQFLLAKVAKHIDGTAKSLILYLHMQS
jgi:hypothetical protein